ncbi:hypothetical protein HNQ04_003557 [Deinococcus radiopugnans ATCC 19172]|uniref:Uncharacterized protein n=1 Tax=Deinococcus radiopugnans ATCC 19172 TaxID=585398 RepID=A0ABR6NXV4_9DEIO|nr:hypothetical protein [Deinococcus radiopugnans ATCC 19172]
MAKGGLWVTDSEAAPLSAGALVSFCRLAAMRLAWLQAESTRRRKIALQLSRDATLESKIRTVARVFHVAPLTPRDVNDVLLPLRPDGRLTLILDHIFMGRTDCRRERAPVWGESSPSGRVPAPGTTTRRPPHPDAGGAPRWRGHSPGVVHLAASGEQWPCGPFVWWPCSEKQPVRIIGLSSEGMPKLPPRLAHSWSASLNLMICRADLKRGWNLTPA